MLLGEHDLWDFIEKLVVEPIDLVLLVEHKKMAKNKWVILGFVMDHLIPHITRKTMGKDMLDVLVTLY